MAQTSCAVVGGIRSIQFEFLFVLLLLRKLLKIYSFFVLTEKCLKMERNEIVGSLCMDLCVGDSVQMPKCATDLLEINTQTDYKPTCSYYIIDGIDSTFILPIKSLEFMPAETLLKQGSTMADLEFRLTYFIKVYIWNRISLNNTTGCFFLFVYRHFKIKSIFYSKSPFYEQ